MTPEEKLLANELFDSGVVCHGPVRMRIHDFLPDFPPAPFYFNLRPNGINQPGPLGQELLHKLARALRAKLDKSGIQFGWIAGIPNAGTPIAFALGNTSPKMPIIWVRKTDMPTPDWVRDQFNLEFGKLPLNLEHGEFPQIVRNNPGLLVDDVIGAATTKHKWIPPLQEHFRIAGLAVLVDREEGGAQIITEKYGLPTLPLFRASLLMRKYAKTGRITEEFRREVFQYRQLVKKAAGELAPRVM